MSRITGHIAYPAGKVRPPVSIMAPPGLPGDLLRMLAEAAEAGDICPSAREIANRLSLTDDRAALSLLRGLRDAGWIDLDTAVGRVPVVTIRDTGRSTRRPTSNREPANDDGLTDKERRVYHMLVAAAVAGALCPSNKAISEALGYASQSAAAHIVGHLEELGLIAVTRFVRARMVTITETGATTAHPFPAAAGGVQ